MIDQNWYEKNKQFITHTKRDPTLYSVAIQIIASRRNESLLKTFTVKTEDELRDPALIKWNKEQLPLQRLKNPKIKPKRTLLYNSNCILKVDSLGNKYPWNTNVEVDHYEITILKALDDFGLSPIYCGTQHIPETNGWYSIEKIYLVDGDIYYYHG